MSAGRSRTEQFNLRLTTEQAARWRQLAADRGCSMSELVRAAVEYCADHAPLDFVQIPGRKLFAELVQEARTVLRGEHPADPTSTTTAEVPCPEP